MKKVTIKSLKPFIGPDWDQVIANGGPPCFFVENGKLCLRAQRWAGHPIHHGYIELHEAIKILMEKE